MVVAIDAMAKRYGKLPSEILTSASTLDLVILDAALTYEHYLHEQSKKSGNTLTTPKVSDDELMRIWEQHNGKNESRSQ